jgi:chromosome segregation ATPase
MAARKKTTRRPKAPDDPAGPRFLVLLEQIQEQNRATIEAVWSLDQKMERRFEEESGKNELRFQSLEAAVRFNSEQIRKNSEDIRKNSEDIRELSDGLTRLATSMDALARRMERVEEAIGIKADAAVVAALDARLRRIEERLGLSSA